MAGDKLHVITSPGECTVDLLMRTLTAQGTTDVQAAPADATLEDVFVSLARDDRRRAKFAKTIRSSATRWNVPRLEIPQAGIEHVADGIAKKIEAEDREENGHAGAEHQPRVNFKIASSGIEHRTPRRCRRLHAQTRNERPASVRIAPAMPSEAWNDERRVTFGRMCSNMMRRSEAPNRPRGHPHSLALAPTEPAHASGEHRPESPQCR